MNPAVDLILAEGCGRCDQYKTPSCKVHLWPQQLRDLRQILLSTSLLEEVKWGIPAYTHQGKVLAMLAPMKDYCALSFMKGSLLDDPEGQLEFAGPNSRHGKLWKFHSGAEVSVHRAKILAFIEAAQQLEEEGRSVPKLSEETLEYPKVLREALEADAGLERAFKSLSLGRQRGYCLHIAAAKQEETQKSRLAKHIPRILEGKGMHDR